MSNNLERKRNLKRASPQGAWVPQSVKHLTLEFGSGHDPRAVGWNPIRLCPETLLGTHATLTPVWSCPDPHRGWRVAQEQRPSPANATETLMVLSQADGGRGLGHPDLGHPGQ